jgi:hypothetical protein
VDTQSPHSAPPAPDLPVLADLVAAGLVSHEMIGDPARLGSETEALKGLCAEVGGPVWRLAPFHYAFRARPEDLGGRLAALDPADWTGALETALRSALGAEAVWISTADLLPGEGAALPEAPLLLLRAEADAVAAGLAAADPGTQAVIHARYAVEAARLVDRLLAEAEPGSALARRLAMIETRQEEMLEMLGERAEETIILGRLSATFEAALERLDAHGAALARLAADTGALADRVAVLAALPDAAAAEAATFRRDLGLALAEFLARLEQEAATRAPLAPALAPRLG